MTLPDGGNIAWPPKQFKDYFDLLDVYNDWYVGDVERLQVEYQQRPITHRGQFNGGIVGWGTRAWLGKPPTPGEARARLHIPLAADIATLSADYLFGEAPRVVLPGDRARTTEDAPQTERDRLQDRVEKVINTSRFHSLLLEGGEVAAALGGVYLRLVWDPETLSTVRAEVVHTDAAVPKFKFGDLSSVVFWSELDNSDDDKHVWRHLEEHRPGEIEHALYKGDDSHLGQRVPLNERPDTEWLAPLVNKDSVLLTGVTGLTAAYVPNMRPNKMFRKLGHLALLGQSDFADITQLFDAVDETWSSWMRDIRIAKARIVVAKEYLQSGSFGQGATFDYDREVYEGMTAITGPNGEPFGFHAHQFQIRTQEHSDTVRDLREQAMRSAGWTPASAGGEAQGVRTATEVHADERLSDRTRDKKINYWKTLTPFFLTWLQLDALVYSLAAPKEEPEFRFPAESQVDVEKMARTTAALRQADAASVETAVRMNHPDWDGDTVNTEVDRIYKEKGIGTAADPTQLTGLPNTDPTAADIARMRDRMAREAAGEATPNPEDA
ncbi:phage portal protein [Microbacterium hominis]|uniref:Phage portal protein n=1 Tax=Microbacterium hominis TaxID=162426 RepID=A0A2K9D513_9MICO|nr:phage portal protein [Microbacterium hominis]AUG28750.1 hypothetical protein CXR34_04190 [Microbacterium hominis]